MGDVYRHPPGQTVTDNVWFTLLTRNTAPIHFDHPLVDSMFTVALVTGQSITDVSQNVMGEVRLPVPVFEGDTSY